MSKRLSSTPSGRDAADLAVVLRAFGCLDLLALAAVLMPHGWMARGHAWAGLGEMPTAPIVGYLARSASFLYALHGATVLFISFDVARYRPLITFLAAVAVVQGAVMLAIDLAEGMPLWWTAFEGPGFSAMGIVVLSLQGLGRRGPFAEQGLPVPGRSPKHREGASMRVQVFNRQGQLVGVDVPKVVKSDQEWAQQLTPDQYRVARGKATERAFCGNLLDNKRHGVYSCVCCGLPLFESGGKFNSGTGWPSFFRPIAAENVVTEEDRGYGMVRTEILCARCDGHLGHVFEDGPPPTGLRYCVNSESLAFTDQADVARLADPAA